MTISRTKLAIGMVGRPCRMGGLRPGLLDRCQQPRIGQQPVQHSQLRRQLTDLDRQQLVEQQLHLPTRQPQHHPPPP
jgi:hypothetical protein